MSTLADSDWLAGFADGEGCFFISPTGPLQRGFAIRFSVSFRYDNIKLFSELQEHFGGFVCPYRPPKETLGGANLQGRWGVQSRVDILGLIKYFDEHRLYGLKKNEYAVWREAAMLYYRHSTGQGREPNPQWLVDVMKEYMLELQRLKEYEAQPQDLTELREAPQLSLIDEVADKRLYPLTAKCGSG